MDAPPTRYRVEEKDGRLIVIDTATGAPASPSAPPRVGAGTRPIAPGRGLVDALCDALVARASTGRDAEGRAVIAWEWKQNRQTKRWDAALDSGQERRLGRALLSFVSAAPLMLVFFIAGHPFIGLFVSLPSVGRGLWMLNRLQAETAQG
ncbi:MAG TPA: hypothetical protein VGD66_07640 [Allosphingosinicella sp.]|jgi:hypothetical protein